MSSNFRSSSAVVAIALLLSLATARAGAQSNEWAIRFWLSQTGVAENEPIAGTPSEFVSYDVGHTAQAVAGSTTRFYIWCSHPNRFSYFDRVGLNIRLNVQTGTAELLNHRFYNWILDEGTGAVRWVLVGQGTRTATLVDNIGGVGGWGTVPRVIGGTDGQWDQATRSMLLGFVDVESAPNTRAELYLGVGAIRIDAPPSGALAYFGWGDAAIARLTPGSESTLPEALIVPEPATATFGVAALGVLMARGRKWRA